MRETPDPLPALKRLYRGAHGYAIPAGDDARVRATKSSPTYGEMLPNATAELLDYLQMGPDDVFYDLGCGIGKVVLQVGMTAPIKRCVGVELARRRYESALEKLAQARAEGLLRAARVELRCADLMRAKISDATVIYTCSTSFPAEFMVKLGRRLAGQRPGLVWVSTRHAEDNPWFDLIDELKLDMSWRNGSTVHVYRLARPRGRHPRALRVS